MEQVQTCEIVPGDYVLAWRSETNVPLTFLSQRTGIVIEVKKNSRRYDTAVRIKLLLPTGEASDEIILAYEWFAIIERLAS
jgi:hypothetical protein